MKFDLEINAVGFCYRETGTYPVLNNMVSYAFENDFADVGEFEEHGFRKLMVVFRGSDDWKDWRKNITLDFNADKFHEWFREEFISNIVRRHEIVVVGHSRGGALAQYFARDCVQMGYNVGRVVTFGCPAIKRSQVKLEHYRVVNGADSIVSLPPFYYLLGRGHSGKLIELNKKRRWRRYLRIVGALQDHFWRDYREGLKNG